MDKREIKATFSADLVQYLRNRGNTLQDIATLMGVSESFVSRVANKERNFTIKHLLMLEDATRQPLPVMLLNALSQETIPRGLFPLYQSARELLNSGTEMRHAFNGHFITLNKSEEKSGRQ